MSFSKRYGPWAFVAGASEGLGEAFAHEIARRGINVIVAARRTELLEKVAQDLRAQHHVEAVALPLDLASDQLATHLENLVSQYELGLLVYNAALSPKGAFLDVAIEDHLRAVQINARGALLCAHIVGRAMRAQKRGGIVMMSSMSGLYGTGSVTSYAATKAFQTNLAEGLWGELEGVVDVVVSVAGPIRTPGYVATAKTDVAHVLEPEQVVNETLDALGNKPVVIPGWRARWGARVLALLPRANVIRIMRRATRKMLTG